MSVKGYAENVVINCPFDDEYYELLYAAVFAVFDCGFVARCSMEEDDGASVRIEKIQSIIQQCKFGIHDISRTELCNSNSLPRFNMPLELGLFLGARRYGMGEQKKKNCLIVDSERYRFQKFISDLSGQDIKAHRCDPQKLIKAIRDWLAASSGAKTIPGAKLIYTRYKEFIAALPSLCEESGVEYDDLIYNDYTTFVSIWLRETAS